MTDKRSICTAIAKKYEATKPPADWPLYGDDDVFTDECNGRRYRGTVLRMHPPLSVRRIPERYMGGAGQRLPRYGRGQYR